jgi:short-subunit dehydrogenase
MPFGEHSTSDEVAEALSSSIKGKTGKSCQFDRTPTHLQTVLIDGTSPKSLGLAAAKSIAKHDPKLLVLVGRSPVKLEASKADIESVAPNVKIQTIVMDLASFKSIRAAAKQVTFPIDVLINNAATNNPTYEETEDGKLLRSAHTT